MTGQKFIVRSGESEEHVVVENSGPGVYLVDIDGVTHHVDARRFAGGTWSLVIDSQSYDVELEVAGDHESEGRYNSLVRGKVIRLSVVDERHARMGVVSKKFAVEGPQTVTTPMPGKVVKILVRVGQDVDEGEALVIVEAMKMENVLPSPKKGRIARIAAEPGQTVDSGAPLLTVE
jgi:biotin carboxyl carrier protein